MQELEEDQMIFFGEGETDLLFLTKEEQDMFQYSLPEDIPAKSSYYQ